MISIAMTTYNGEKYLREQIDSILNQTIKNFELIICDDCSKDNTWQILEEYSAKDDRIKIYKNETNLGFKRNFEKAITLCKGDYIALSDQDDIWTENHLELLYKNIQGRSASSANASMIDSNGNIMPYDLAAGDKYYHAGNDIDTLFTILCYRNPFFGAISMYSTGKYLNTLLPIPSFVKYHDLWFSLVACCMDGLSYIPEHLVLHRLHGKNESGEHHITLREQVCAAFSRGDRKEFSENRIKMCEELFKRIPDMASDKKKVLEEIIQYHKNKLNKKRLIVVCLTIKHYKQIYSTSNYKQLFARCIGLLLQRI